MANAYSTESATGARGIAGQAYHQILHGDDDRGEALLNRALAMDRGQLHDWEIAALQCLIALRREDFDQSRQHGGEARRTEAGQAFLTDALKEPPSRLSPAAVAVLEEVTYQAARERWRWPGGMAAAVAIVMLLLAGGTAYFAFDVISKELGASDTSQSNRADAKAREHIDPGRAVSANEDHRINLNALETLLARVVVRVEVVSGPGRANQKIAVGWGTAFVVNEDGTFLTNRHVVDTGAEIVEAYEDAVDWDIVVTLGDSDELLEGRILHLSAYRDLALVKVDRTFDRAMRFARDYRRGDKVVTYGFPDAASELVAAMNPAETRGRIRRFREALREGRTPTVDDVVGRHINASSFTGTIGSIRETERGRLVQTDARVYPGMSGGPMLNPAGEVIGIVTAGHSQVEGINVAIAWESIREDLGSVADINWPETE